MQTSEYQWNRVHTSTQQFHESLLTRTNPTAVSAAPAAEQRQGGQAERRLESGQFQLFAFVWWSGEGVIGGERFVGSLLSRGVRACLYYTTTTVSQSHRAGGMSTTAKQATEQWNKYVDFVSPRVGWMTDKKSIWVGPIFGGFTRSIPGAAELASCERDSNRQHQRIFGGHWIFPHTISCTLTQSLHSSQLPHSRSPPVRNF